MPISIRVKKIGLERLRADESFSKLIHLDLYRAVGDPKTFSNFLQTVELPVLRAIETLHWSWLPGLVAHPSCSRLWQIRNLDLSFDAGEPGMDRDLPTKQSVLLALRERTPSLELLECVACKPSDIGLLVQTFPSVQVLAELVPGASPPSFRERARSLFLRARKVDVRAFGSLDRDRKWVAALLARAGK